MEEIKNSPGYFISRKGKVYNSNLKELKPFVNEDGYLRIGLPSMFHGKRVNRTIHLLVAAAYLKDGRYVNIENDKEVNHKDGNKLNNDVSNLEIITRLENVTHAHKMGLCKLDIKINCYDKETNKNVSYWSLRQCSRDLKLSLNYLRARIKMSFYFPIKNRYILTMDYDRHEKYISIIKNLNKNVIYTYCYIEKKYYKLKTFVQISIMFSLSYIHISRKLKAEPKKVYYFGGASFSLSPFECDKHITKAEAYKDRINEWTKLATNEKNVGLKRVGIESLKSKSRT